MARTCASCGATLPEPARFCPRCGRPCHQCRGKGWKAFWVIPLIVLISMMLFGRLARHGGHRPVAPMMPLEPLEMPSAGPAARHLEISANAGILLNRTIAADRLRLHGVGLGDPRTQIPSYRIRSSNGPYIQCTDGNLFYTTGGSVSQIILEDPRLLSNLAIHRRDDIAHRLGEPDVTHYSSNPTPSTLFTYPLRGLSIRWDESSRSVTQITLSAPADR